MPCGSASGFFQHAIFFSCASISLNVIRNIKHSERRKVSMHLLKQRKRPNIFQNWLVCQWPCTCFIPIPFHIRGTHSSHPLHLTMIRKVYRLAFMNYPHNFDFCVKSAMLLQGHAESNPIYTVQINTYPNEISVKLHPIRVLTSCPNANTSLTRRSRRRRALFRAPCSRSPAFSTRGST